MQEIGTYRKELSLYVKNSGKPVTRKVRQVIQEDSEEDNGPEVDEEDDEESLQLNALRATDFDSDF